MSKVIVITGASAGIGAELARQLTARGQRVMLAARSQAALAQVKQECGANAAFCVTDVTERAQVNGLLAETLRVFGSIDVWVNNAGRGISRPVLELTDEDVDEMLTVNVKSALYGMQAVVPYFQAQGSGHVINVSSILGRIPLSSPRSAYNAAKAALNSLTANLRVDLQATHPNLWVSLVMPGPVATDFAANARYGAAPARPMPNVQSVEVVAATIVKLIDEPQAEVYTNPALHVPMVQRYYADVAAFESELRQR